MQVETRSSAGTRVQTAKTCGINGLRIIPTVKTSTRVEAIEVRRMTPYYEDEWVTIYHGDCREILPFLPKVDLVLTDPIYGVSQPGVKHEHGIGKGARSFDFFANDSPARARDLAVQAATLTLPLMQSHGSAYWWVSHRQFGPLIDFYEASGWTTRFLAWRKTVVAPPPPGSGWPSGIELCVYAFRAGRMSEHVNKLKDIKEHPERHHHDFYELQACCMVNGAVDAMLMEEHPVLGRNGSRKCDVIEGPCCCGAWH